MGVERIREPREMFRATTPNSWSRSLLLSPSNKTRQMSFATESSSYDSERHDPATISMTKTLPSM